MTSFSAFAKTRIVPILAFVFAAILLTMSACEEIPPTLNINGESTGPVSNELNDQLSGVLVEEFTGVKCVNCPAGAEAIALLKGTHKERLVPISLHAGFFSSPYPESTIDFRTAAADAVETFIGGPQGYPSSVIDRKQFQGESSLQLSQNSWAGYIDLQLQADPAVAIGVELAYEESDRGLTVDVELLGRTGTDGRNASITVLLLENKVINVQLTPEGKDLDYSHEHVLRSAITSPTGEPLGAIAAGASMEEAYTFTVPSDINTDNVEIVVFVHYADADAGGKEILQAVSKKLGE
ncbi:MAG: Omp28-related outer membrane protein [Saprospiraceae bacterium]